MREIFFAIFLIKASMVLVVSALLLTTLLLQLDFALDHSVISFGGHFVYLGLLNLFLRL